MPNHSIIPFPNHPKTSKSIQILAQIELSNGSRLVINEADDSRYVVLAHYFPGQQRQSMTVMCLPFEDFGAIIETLSYAYYQSEEGVS